MSALRLPGLGPIVAHTTATTSRIWVLEPDSEYEVRVGCLVLDIALDDERVRERRAAVAACRLEHLTSCGDLRRIPVRWRAERRARSPDGNSRLAGIRRAVQGQPARDKPFAQSSSINHVTSPKGVAN